MNNAKGKVNAKKLSTGVLGLQRRVIEYMVTTKLSTKQLRLNIVAVSIVVLLYKEAIKLSPYKQRWNSERTQS